SITLSMLKELAENVKRVEAKKAVHCVIVAGAGNKAFCAGADLKERAGWSDEQIRGFLGQLRSTFRAVEHSAKVYVAALNGVALVRREAQAEVKGDRTRDDDLKDGFDKRLVETLARVRKGGAEKYHAKNKEQKKLFARERLRLLLDDGSFVEDAALANVQDP